MLRLNNPYPNPFNNKVSIPIYIENSGHYGINIYNIIGERVIHEDYYFNSLGIHHLVIDFTQFSSGTYFIQKSGMKNSEMNKIILLK